MLVGRKSNWYRSYYIIASGREYKVKEIHFYKDGKILASSFGGWLEKENGGDIESIELPVDQIKAKRKENFNGEIFIISKGKETYSDDLIAELYIPAEIFNIKFKKNIIEYSSQVRAIYTGDNDIYISVYIKSIDEELNNIQKQYEEIYRKCDLYCMRYNSEETIKNIDKLKEYANKYIQEKKRIEKLTINDIKL